MRPKASNSNMRECEHVILVHPGNNNVPRIRYMIGSCGVCSWRGTQCHYKKEPTYKFSWEYFRYVQNVQVDLVVSVLFIYVFYFGYPQVHFFNF